MNSREAFKVGFLLGCADQGLNGEQAKELMHKAASLLEKVALLDWLPPAALTAGVSLPVIAGLGAGYMAHSIGQEDVDAEDVQNQELIDELKKWARRARESTHTKKMRAYLE